MIPTADFCQQARARKWARLQERKQRHAINDEGSQPELRRDKLIARDVHLANEMRLQAVQLGVPWFEVDGSRSVEELLAMVEHFYDPFLMKYYRQPRTS